MGDLGQRNVPELPKGLRSGAGGVGPLRAGRITLEEALKRYQLTEEEYRSWERAFEQHGLAGLRSTRLQQYRGPRPPRGPRSRRCPAVSGWSPRAHRLPAEPSRGSLQDRRLP
jgi:hypothetical protein